jgi:multidrug efflux pump subunit AcrA (membrane-fusion protein)
MSVYLSMGSSARAYHPYIVVANPSAFELSAELTDSVVLKLGLGQEVIIELTDHPNRPLKGFIRRLPYHMGRSQSNALEDIDRSTRIRFVPPEDISLKVGDLARATIVLEEREDVLYLPPEALRMYQGRRFVVVEEDDRRKRMDIKTGLHSEDRVEIEQGLEEGQIIIGQ